MKHLLNLLDLIVFTGNFILGECLNDLLFALLLLYGHLFVWIYPFANSFLLSVIFMIRHILLLIIILLRIILSDHMIVVTLAKINIHALIISIEGIEFFGYVATNLEGFTLHEIYGILFKLFHSYCLHYHMQILSRELYELESRALFILPCR